MNVNIGGGRGWRYGGWVNFDQQQGFLFTPTVTFPVEDKSADYVYSSHCLEHLDDETVDQVLSEARRMCSGKLVLKLPDFDEIMNRWESGDVEYFNHWGMNGVVKTWGNRGIEDNINSRASMIFCGWWNEAYGDEWGNRKPEALGAYHGPAWPATPGDLSPHELSMWMKSKAPEGGTFNHQNAWSRFELQALLRKHGFDVQTMDENIACSLPIPTITEMRGISMYAVAK